MDERVRKQLPKWAHDLIFDLERKVAEKERLIETLMGSYKPSPDHVRTGVIDLSSERSLIMTNETQIKFYQGSPNQMLVHSLSPEYDGIRVQGHALISVEPRAANAVIIRPKGD